MSGGAVRTTIDAKWRCGWFPECNTSCQPPCDNRNHRRRKCAAYGLHELKDCVHGKWGFYYSPDGHIREWGGIHQYNPSGCAVVYLLIYNRDKQQFLFDVSKNGEYNMPSHRRVTYDPEDLHIVAMSTLASLLLPGNQHVSLASIPRRFIFTDASVIYPVCLNNENVSQIIFKSGRKWIDRKDVEQAMELVTLEWTIKVDNQSFGYSVKDKGARLGQRPVFPVTAFVLRWLAKSQDVGATATSRVTTPALASDSACSSISASISNCTSAYASASVSPSMSGASTTNEPDYHNQRFYDR